MNRSRGKLPPGQKNCLPTRMLAHRRRCYWTANSVCYWTDTTFVIGWLQRLLSAAGFTYCVIFATLKNLFFTATVQGDFFGWMSRIYYRWGWLHEVSGHQAFSCRRCSQDERQPRRCILEKNEGDRSRARPYLVRADWRDRFRAGIRQSVIRTSAFRARVLSKPDFRSQGGARRTGSRV